MAAVLTLTMHRSRLTCLIVSFVLCTHLVKSTMSLPTKRDFGMRHSRKRRQDNCSESRTFEVLNGKYDRNARYELEGHTLDSARHWCKLSTQCTTIRTQSHIGYSDVRNIIDVPTRRAIMEGRVCLRPITDTPHCDVSVLLHGQVGIVGVSRRVQTNLGLANWEKHVANQCSVHSHARQMSPARL